MLKKELIYYLVITCISSSNLEAKKHYKGSGVDGTSGSQISKQQSRSMTPGGCSPETGPLMGSNPPTKTVSKTKFLDTESQAPKSKASGWWGRQTTCKKVFLVGIGILGGAGLLLGGLAFLLLNGQGTALTPSGRNLSTTPHPFFDPANAEAYVVQPPKRKIQKNRGYIQFQSQTNGQPSKDPLSPYTQPPSHPKEKPTTPPGENSTSSKTKSQNEVTNATTTPVIKNPQSCSYENGKAIGDYRCTNGLWEGVKINEVAPISGTGWQRLKKTEQNGYKVFIDARVVDDKNQIVSDAPADPVEKFHDVRWTDVRHQFDCGSQWAYEGQQCQMRFDGKWSESLVTSSDPNCVYTQKVSCPENLNLQGADCWLKECSGEDLRGEIWEPGKRFQISYQYDWEGHIKTWPHTADSGSVALPKDLREICSDQIMLWPKHVLGLQKNSKPYLIHASIGTFPNKGTTKDWNTSGGPEKFTTNQEVIEGNIWLQESHFKDRLGKGEGLCNHEFGHFFIAPQNPLFKLWSVNEGEKISFKGPKAMAFFGGTVPLVDAAHWAQNMKHASTGEAISGLPMSGDLHNWKISNLTLWAMEDMGIGTTVSKFKNQG